MFPEILTLPTFKSEIKAFSSFAVISEVAASSTNEFILVTKVEISVKSVPPTNVWKIPSFLVIVILSDAV